MNPELLTLLREVGITTRLEWSDVVTVYNYAPVPVAYRTSDVGYNRGFNLVVLDGATPTHFVKCRPAHDATLIRESRIRATLSQQRTSGIAVGVVTVASSSRLSIQASPFLLGPHYGDVIQQMPSDDYVNSLAGVLGGIFDVASAALRNLPEFFQHPPSLDLATVANESLSLVSDLASLSDGERLALTHAVVHAGAVAPRPQHGDFWWQNLILADGTLWAIDFDSYGESNVPLFDELTMLITTLGLRCGSVTKALQHLESRHPEAVSCRALLRRCAAAQGVVNYQLNGLLVYYLTHMAATIYRRGGRAFSVAHVAAVRFAAERLAAGEESLLAHE